jgi:hypothetical protein
VAALARPAPKLKFDFTIGRSPPHPVRAISGGKRAIPTKPVQATILAAESPGSQRM